MALLVNVIRVVLAGLWTAVVGGGVSVIVYLGYGLGWLCDRAGRRDVFDRLLAFNVLVMGWAAQRLWASVLLKLGGIRLHVRELAPVDWQRAHVICANHASVFDILAMVRAVPPPFRFVAKKELLKWPFLGWVLRPSGQIIVDRRVHTSALQSMARAREHNVGGQVIFFVEGTRSRTGSLLPFKKGAFHFAHDQQMPILPAAVHGSYAVLAKRPWWRLNPGRDIEVRFCGLIHPMDPVNEPSAHNSVDILLDRTRASIEAALAQGDSAGASPPPA